MVTIAIFTNRMDLPLCISVYRPLSGQEVS